MKILYLSHCLPFPPDKGERIRAYQQLWHLTRRHEVHLLALSRGETSVPEELAELCASSEVYPVGAVGGRLRSAAGVLGRQPLTLRYFRSRALQRRVDELARRERFDAVVAYTSAMVPYARRINSGTPLVLDMVDVDSAKWSHYSKFAGWPMRWVYGLEARRMQRLEASLQDFSSIVLTTTREVEELRSFAPALSASAVGIGVRFDPSCRLPLPKSDPPSLVFTGQMDYFANVDGVTHFARNVFPGLRQRFPGLEFVIVGRSPTEDVVALEEVQGVVVTGEVAEVAPFLARASVFVAPLRIARGLQTKVLEAMAARVPVVCSRDVGAGLVDGGFRSGRDLVIADGDDDLAEGIAAVLDRPTFAEHLARNALARVRSAYSFESATLGFERVLEAAAPAARPDDGDRCSPRARAS